MLNNMNNLFPNNIPQLMKLLEEWEYSRLKGKKLPIEYYVNQCPEFPDLVRRYITMLEEMDWLMVPGTTNSNSNDIDLDSSITTNFKNEHNECCKEFGYHLIEPIGYGGSGQIWKAEGLGDMPVAIKIISLDNKLSMKEIRALDLFKTIRHPHLLSIFGFWFKNNKLWIASELADCNLYDVHQSYIAQGDPGIPFPLLIRYFGEAAEAIDFLNLQKHRLFSGLDSFVQHGDIKLHNLLIAGNSIKLGDFGLARCIGSETNSHSGYFTTSYAPPEYFDGKTYPASDQYSLAVSYVRLRGGAFPFNDLASEKIASARYRSPNLANIPVAERPHLQRALAINPRERWPDCRSFIEALKSSTQIKQ